MQRMIIEDFAKTGLKVAYACPMEYIEVMEDHPYLDELKEMSTVKDHEYGIIYDITTICAVSESVARGKNDKHRSDIWANYCGVKLENHETYLKSDPEIKEIFKNKIKELNPNNKKVVFICTKSTKDQLGIAKTLTDDQIKETISKIKELDVFLVTADKEFQEIYSELEVQQFMRLNTKSWIALIDACDAIVSVDTGAFHIAGALKKPLVGIFGFTDGKLYGKYYNFKLVQKHRDNGDWPCGPCYFFHDCIKDKISLKKPCITELKPSDIVDALKTVLSQ